MNTNKSYPSKLLLLGEYGILLGSSGLALPYPAFSGSLSFEKESSEEKSSDAIMESNGHLNSLYGYMNASPEMFDFIDLSAFEDDIKRGMWFNSNIPQGYGVGSSGALTAALFDRYAPESIKNLPLPHIRKKLASIEQYFHGTSSGLDPLVSYTHSPILVENKDKISTPDLLFIQSGSERSHTGLFLVDSGKTNPTGSLVQWFLEQYQDWEFRRAINEVYFPAIEQAIGAFLQNNFRTFQMSFETITGFQMQFMNPLIPSTLMDHLEHGLLTGSFFLKLCGSGGGGFMLGLTTDGAKTEEYFKFKGINTLFL